MSRSTDQADYSSTNRYIRIVGALPASLLFIIGFTFACAGGPSGQSADEVANSAKAASVERSSQIESSPGASSAPAELQFLDTLVALNRRSIDIAKQAESKLTSEVLRRMANAVVSDREREIAQLTLWRRAWYGTMPDAVNADIPGVHVKLPESELDDASLMRRIAAQDEGAISLAEWFRSTGQREAKHRELSEFAVSLAERRATEVEQLKSRLDR